MIAANDNEPLRFFSVCSGIEAASCAWPDWVAVGYAEIEKFPSAVLAHHYPETPNHGDFTKVQTSTLGRVDVLCGGTPCQAFSVAGARRSLDDARGNLTLAFVDLAHELAGGNGLRNAVWENVPGVLSTKDNAFGCFLAGLVGADAPLVPPDAVWGIQTHFDAESYDVHRTFGWQSCTWPNEGMVEGPRARAAWRILDAQYFGLAQRRRRVIVVADFGDGADPAAVLFERASMQGNHPPSREAREGIAPTISARTKGGGGLGTDFDLDGGLIEAVAFGGNRTSGPIDVAAGLNAKSTMRGDFETETFICFSAKDCGADAQVDLAPTLRAGGHTSSHANAGVMPAIAFGWQNSSSQGDSVSEEVVPTLDKSKTPVAFMPARTLAKDGGIDERFAERDICDAIHTSSGAGNKAPLLAQTVSLRGREGGATAEVGGDVATALRASSGGGDKPHVLTTAVRRLTPKECERLQGFLDCYTKIPWRGKPASECPDGPRYKALGNSWAVPKFRWLGKRIERLMPPLAANDNACLAKVA